jgi:hypothetical protein
MDQQYWEFKQSDEDTQEICSTCMQSLEYCCCTASTPYEDYETEADFNEDDIPF